MAYPTTSWPVAVDAVVARVDLVNTVFADDFNYPDDQIRTVQSWLGINGDLIGDDGTATHGPGGLLSPIASGGVGITLATRAAYAGGTVLEVVENYDIAPAVLFTIGHQGQLRAVDGVVGIPAYSFENDPNSGIYSVGADQVGLTTAGTLRLTVEAAGELTVNANYIQGLTGAVFDEAADHPIAPAAGEGQIWVKNAAPCELWFTDDAGTDVQLGTSALWGRAGTVLSPANAGDTLTVGVGAVGAPGYSFEVETDTGMYLVSSTPDVIGFATNGGLRASISAAQMLNVDGAVGAPGYSFVSDPDSGLYSLGADILGLAGNGENYASWGPFYAGHSTGANQGTLEFEMKRIATIAHGASTVAYIRAWGVDAAAASASYTKVSFNCISDVAGAEEGEHEFEVANGTTGAFATVSTIGRYGLRTIDGVVGNPSHSFISYTDSGMYLVSNTPDVIGFACDGALAVSMSAAQMLNVDGTAALPGYSFISETNMGFWRAAAGRLSLSFGGATLYSWTSASFYSATSKSFKLARAVGAFGAPTYSFQGYSDAGMYFTTETRPDTSTIDTVHFATEGTLRVSISSTGLRVPYATVAAATAMDAGNNDTAMAGDLLVITDETSGFTLAYYDGTDFRRVQDRAIIS